MSLNKIVVKMFFAAILIIGLQSCYEVATVLPDTNVEVTGPVSFKSDIVPILNQNCSVSGCHSSGGIKPDLSDANAYASLDKGGYWDLNTPENSSIYLWLTGKKSSTMPPNGNNNPSNINQLVLAWVKQGAKNN